MKQIALIVLILGAGIYLGAQILKMEPPRPKEEHGEHASEGKDSHGHEHKESEAAHEEPGESNKHAEHEGHDKHEDEKKNEGAPDSHGHEHKEGEVAHEGEHGTAKKPVDDCCPPGEKSEPGVLGRIPLSSKILQESGIVLGMAEKKAIQKTLTLNGKITPNEEGVAHVFPRYPGVVKEVRKRLGESVQKGEVLALIESNESLQVYEVKSPIEGRVIEKHLIVGETVHSESEMFVVADLRTVWVDLNVHRHDFHLVKVGQKVRVDAGDGGNRLESTVAYVSPVGASNSQSMLARAEIPNADGAWKPGLFVKGEILLEESEASVTVPATAIQTFEGKEVVFVYAKETFEAREVTLGRRDSEKVEVLSGLKAGEQMAVQNSFVLKSDLGKSEAGHCH